MASTIPSKSFHGRYDLVTQPQYYPIPAAPGVLIDIGRDACSEYAKERWHIHLPIGASGIPSFDHELQHGDCWRTFEATCAALDRLAGISSSR
jgi:hypothetical protein